MRVALVVDADPLSRNTLGALLPFCGIGDVRQASSTDDGLAQLDDTVDVVLCDPCLESHRGVAVFDAALRMEVVPRLIALSDDAPRTMVFRLMYHGVSALLEKPFRLEDVAGALEMSSKKGLAPLAQLARARVGAMGAKEAQQVVRRSMFEEALSRTDGNRHAAARLLRVNRRVVQLMANSLGEGAK